MGQNQTKPTHTNQTYTLPSSQAGSQSCPPCPPCSQSKESFEISTRDVTFTYIDILVVLIVAYLVYYYMTCTKL